MKDMNVLFIISDQHRSDCLGAFGNSEIHTDHLDSLVRDGVAYKNAFCTAPVCTPSRYSILTGMYPHQHQGYTNESSIPHTYLTFPSILRDHGYHTEVIGKMHTNPSRLDVGYEKVLLAEQTEPGRYEDDYHQYLEDKGLVDEIDVFDQVESARKNAPQEYWDTFGAMESTLSDEDYSTTWIGEHAIESLKSWKGNNNLLTVSFIKPHHPFDPPAPWSEMYHPDDLNVLPGWTENLLEQDMAVHEGYFPNKNLTEAKLKNIMANYYGTISHIDHYVGKFIEVLKEKNLYKDTLIIYTSDHGEYLGFHHMILKSNNMYDPLVKVPLIIKYPKEYLENNESQMLVNNIDIAPTILDVAGITKNQFMAGDSLLQLKDDRDFVYTEDGWGEAYMIRSNKYKLLLRKDDSKSLFFDLEADPLELNNLYHDENYQSLINEYKLQIGNFILFEQPSPIYKPTKTAGGNKDE